MKKLTVLFLTAALIILSACSKSSPDLTTARNDMAANGLVEGVTKPAADQIAETATGSVSAKPTETSAVFREPESGLSKEPIRHSFGVAKNGKPHSISVNNQKFLEDKGFNAVVYDTKTQSKVLYLTFDCGWENGYTNKILDTIKEKQVPAAFFCTLHNIKAEPELIARMIAEGHIVGNHSSTHPDFSTLTRERIVEEITTCENYLKENFNYSAPFFRFPEGTYSEYSLDVVQSLGYKSVFWSLAYADWDVNNTKGGDYAFSTVTARLHPGAVILLHSVSPDNSAALGRIIDHAREQGYEFKSLTELP
ncbi:MAG: polysaccharide deacetylase family protein [Clostridiales bacterium]|nr:polysaccharide deacetylase family protein [Clostridiales bacterium]